MGILPKIGIWVWFGMDVVINAGLFFYGSKQSIIPEVKKHFKLLWVLLILAWLATFFFFIHPDLNTPLSDTSKGDDTPIGAITAIISNVVMSALFIFMVFRDPSLWRISVNTAWYKFIGTGCVTIIAIHHFRDKLGQFPLIFTLGGISFALDIWYICLLYHLQQFKEGHKNANQHPLQIKKDELQKLDLENIH